MGKLTFEIPEDLAREALAETETQRDAEQYVMDRVDDIHLVWPDVDDSGSTPITKCHREELRRSN